MKNLACLLCVSFGAMIAFLAANDVLCRLLIMGSSNANPMKMARLERGYPADEIAIIGSSRAETHILPSVMGESFFNYGICAEGQKETLSHLKKLMARGGTSPIIVNLDPWGLRKGVWRGDYCLAASACGIDSWPGVRFFGKFRQCLSAWNSCRRDRSGLCRNGGRPNSGVRNAAEWAGLAASASKVTCSVDPDLLSDYLRILTGDHPLVFFVISPVTESWHDSFKGKDELDSLCRKLASCPKTRVLDLMTCNLGKYPLEMFFDEIHLNREGAVRFSRELRDRLLEELP